jgi:hypothetical protein
MELVDKYIIIIIIIFLNQDRMAISNETNTEYECNS